MFSSNPEHFSWKIEANCLNFPTEQWSRYVFTINTNLWRQKIVTKAIFSYFRDFQYPSVLCDILSNWIPVSSLGREFLNLVSKNFPKNHQYHKIFNKNNIKVSNSCTDNPQTIIEKHNRKSSRQARHPPRKTTVTAGKETTALWKTTASLQASSTTLT